MKAFRFHYLILLIVTASYLSGCGLVLGNFSGIPSNGGGDNELEGFTMIYTIEELQDISNDPKGAYALANNIDATKTKGWNEGEGFKPISTFSGILDGQGYIISNLYINRPEDSFVGLFSQTSSDGSQAETTIIRNVGLENVEIIGRSTTGGLVGLNRGEVIEVYVTGTVTGQMGSIGGLAGRNDSPHGKIIKSYSAADVSGNDHNVGGMVGTNGGIVINSYATSMVTNTANSTGVLVGLNSGEVTRSIGNGTVEGREFVGVLVGRNYGGKISRSYSRGFAEGSAYVGGLTGRNEIVSDEGGEISDSYSTASASASGGHVGGLIGLNSGYVTRTYSIGQATGTGTSVGGLIGRSVSPENVTSSYWDVQASGLLTSNGGGVGIFSSDMADETFWAQETDWDMDFGGGEGGIWRLFSADQRPQLKSLPEPIFLD